MSTVLYDGVPFWLQSRYEELKKRYIQRGWDPPPFSLQASRGGYEACNCLRDMVARLNGVEGVRVMLTPEPCIVEQRKDEVGQDTGDG